MRYLLTCTLFLLLCAPVGAEDCNTCKTDLNGTTSCTLMNCPKNDGPIVYWSKAYKQEVCLAQLEAAMRAMDTFTPERGEKTWWRARADGTESQYLKDKDRAQNIWQAAKKACWKEKP